MMLVGTDTSTDPSLFDIAQADGMSGRLDARANDRAVDRDKIADLVAFTRRNDVEFPRTLVAGNPPDVPWEKSPEVTSTWASAREITRQNGRDPYRGRQGDHVNVKTSGYAPRGSAFGSRCSDFAFGAYPHRGRRRKTLGGFLGSLGPGRE